jgi:hypothetical protein
VPVNPRSVGPTYDDRGAAVGATPSIPAYPAAMTRDEAQAAAARLSAEHPERARYRWFGRRDANGDWSIARVRIPAPRAPDRLTNSAQPKQATPPDEHPLELPGGLPPWVPGI